MLYSVFRAQTADWSAFQPMFAPSAAPITDWLPTFSETGLWMSFVRYNHATSTGQLLAAQYSPASGWSVPEVVLADSSGESTFLYCAHICR